MSNVYNLCSLEHCYTNLFALVSAFFLLELNLNTKQLLSLSLD